MTADQASNIKLNNFIPSSQGTQLTLTEPTFALPLPKRADFLSTNVSLADQDTKSSQRVTRAGKDKKWIFSAQIKQHSSSDFKTVLARHLDGHSPRSNWEVSLGAVQIVHLSANLKYCVCASATKTSAQDETHLSGSFTGAMTGSLSSSSGITHTQGIISGAVRIISGSVLATIQTQDTRSGISLSPTGPFTSSTNELFIYSVAGVCVLPPITLNSIPFAISLSENNYLMVLTCDGTFKLWSLDQECLIATSSILSLLSAEVTVKKAILLTNGIPHISLSNSQSYIFHLNMKIWMRIIDKGEDTVMSSEDESESNLLSNLQGQSRQRKSGSLEAAMKTAQALELQRASAVAVESISECRKWTEKYAIHLCKFEFDERLRELLQSLLGPVTSRPDLIVNFNTEPDDPKEKESTMLTNEPAVEQLSPQERLRAKFKAPSTGKIVDKSVVWEPTLINEDKHILLAELLTLLESRNHTSKITRLITQYRVFLNALQ